jgi:hypothetical protein
LTVAFLGSALATPSGVISLAFAFDTVAMIDLALGQTLNPCQVLRPERVSNSKYATYCCCVYQDKTISRDFIPRCQYFFS